MAQAQLVVEKKKRDFLWRIFTTAFSSEIENSKFLRGVLDPHLIIGDGAAHLLFELPNAERSRIWMQDAQKRLDAILRFALGYFLPIFVRFTQRYQHEIKLSSPAVDGISGEDICRLIQEITSVQFPETLRREYPKFYPDMFYLLSWVDKMSGRWSPPVGFNFFTEWSRLLLETGGPVAADPVRDGGGPVPGGPILDDFDSDDEDTFIATSSPVPPPTGPVVPPGPVPAPASSPVPYGPAALSPLPPRSSSSSPIPNNTTAPQELPAKLIRSKRRMQLFANRVGKPHLPKLFPVLDGQQHEKQTGTGRSSSDPPTPTPSNNNNSSTGVPYGSADYDTCDCQKGSNSSSNDHRQH